MNSSLKQQAMQCLQGNRFVDAKRLAAKACKADRQDVEAWTLLAAANASLGAVDEVAEVCRTIIRLQPDNVAGHYNLGVACQTLGKHERAEKAYRQALALQPENHAVNLNLGSVLIAQGRAQEAAAVFEQLLVKDPQLAPAHSGLGVALRQLGQLDPALTSLRKALEIAPQSPEVHYNLGATLAAAGDTAVAVDSFNEAVRLKPDYVEAHYELAMTLIHAKRYPEAEAALLRVLSLRPGQLAARFQLGHTYYLQEKFPQAVTAYREVLQRDPGNVPALNNLGRIYERTGQFDDAIRQYRQALKHKKRDSVIHCNIGRTLMAQRHWSAAAKEYREAIACAPDNYEGYLGLGRASCELGELERATKCFHKTLELKPDLPIARFLLASLEKESSTDDAATEYVVSLFDDYADRFDEDLVGRLDYHIPELINDTIRSLLENPAERLDVLDLGCGTGLCGPLLKDIALRLDGVDISSRMIEKARERSVYDELSAGDLTSEMNQSRREYDLVIAADVFVYIGDLAPVFEACMKILRSGGLFAFSVESHDGHGFRLLSSGRHAHATSYIEELCSRNGLLLKSQIECTIRLELGNPVKGMLYVASRP